MIPTVLGILLTVSVAAVARRTEKSWMSPPAFFALLWAAYAASAVFFVTDLDAYAPAMLWLFFASASVLAGAYLTHRMLPGRGRIWQPRLVTETTFPYLKLITAALVVVGLLEVVYIFAKSNFSLISVVSFAIISQVSALNRSAFGFGELEQGIIERVAYVFIYTAPLFGGILFRVTSSLTGKTLSILSLFFVVFVSVLYGSRMGVLFGGSFWIASYMATYVLASAPAGRIDDRFLVRIGIISVVVILGLSLLAMITRYHSTGDRNRPLMMLISDPLAFIAAFAIWFESEGMRFEKFMYGYRTFLRLFQVFGVRIEWAPAIDVGFSSSNIFTVFRGLIEDFGIVGALVWLFGFGAVSGMAYQRVLEGLRGFLPLLTLAFAFTFVSVSFSLFAYAAPTIAIFFFFTYFLAVHRLETAAVSLSARIRPDSQRVRLDP